MSSCFVLQVSVFDKAAEMYSGDSCRMARLVASKTCSQVHARLLKVRSLTTLLVDPSTGLPLAVACPSRAY